ncbi:MAG: hypothetical protein ACK57U_14085, partial [Planctomycetota bacterium]
PYSRHSPTCEFLGSTQISYFLASSWAVIDIGFLCSWCQPRLMALTVRFSTKERIFHVILLQSHAGWQLLLPVAPVWLCDLTGQCSWRPD